MRRLLSLGLLSATALMLAAPADAQTRRVTRVIQSEQPLVLNVRPRSFLDAGTQAIRGSENRYATQDIVSYVNTPPYVNMRDRFGHGTLPDPIHGAFVGARNPFGPVDYGFR
ncbi:MAG TPA: hypothetical protein VGU24_21760 [Microvirga sp.]|jgi:hypothetical protein|nr:hypothetical protein [Microvirga sp.]